MRDRVHPPSHRTYARSKGGRLRPFASATPTVLVGAAVTILGVILAAYLEQCWAFYGPTSVLFEAETPWLDPGSLGAQEGGALGGGNARD